MSDDQGTSRTWCGTFNNFSKHQPDPAGLKWPDNVAYAVWQHEQGGEEQTHHLQMYVEFKVPVRQPRGPLNKLWGVPKLSKAQIAADVKPEGAFFNKKYEKSSRAQARAYCMKKDPTFVAGPWEHGTWTGEVDGKAVTAGARTEVGEWHESIKSGKTLDEVMLLFPEETLKHSGGMAAYYNAWHRLHPPPSEITELREWQRDLETILLGPADPRKIIWVHDAVGNTGKTAFIKYMVTKHHAFATSNGKSADIAHAWKGEGIVLFNYPRTAQGHINYGVVEAIKDGLISSPKYDSHTKVFPTPHIVCMSNSMPDMEAWSADRYQIIQL